MDVLWDMLQRVETGGMSRDRNVASDDLDEHHAMGVRIPQGTQSHLIQRAVGSGASHDSEAGPWIGHTISHYEIVDRIGGGGMGVIYQARDLRLDRPVAIKLMAL